MISKAMKLIKVTAEARRPLAQLDPVAFEALLPQIELTAHTPMSITNRDDLRNRSTSRRTALT